MPARSESAMAPKRCTWPPIKISPSYVPWAQIPESVLISVDLPAPFSPHSACTSAGRRSKSTPRNASTCPKRFTSPRASSTGLCPSGLAIYFLAGVEAVLDHGVIDVVFGDRDDIEQDRGHFTLVVVDLGLGNDRFTGGKGDGDLSGATGQVLHRLVDAHRLLATNDALHRDRLGILARDDHFAREAFFFQSLNRTARGAIIRCQYGVDVVAVLGDGRIHDALGVFRLPIVRPVFVHDLNRAGSNRVFERLVLAVLERDRVVVGLGAVDAHEPDRLRGGELIEDELRLQLANVLVVERHVQVEIAVVD